MMLVTTLLGIVPEPAYGALQGFNAPRSSLETLPLRSGSLDPERDCMEPVPESVSLDDVTDAGRQVALDVVVVLDGIPRQMGVELLSKAADAYAPLDVAVTGRFKKVSLPRDGVVKGPDGKQKPTGDFRNLFRATKEIFGGERPQGADIVHLITSKDIFYTSAGQERYGVQGVADCIGGVRYPERAFSMSEAKARYEDSTRDQSLKSFAAKVAAHEIGHLMGAQHHYANCVEGNREPGFAGLPEVCTLMSGIGFLVAINFGTIEGAVVRGHAVEFAAP